MAEHSQQRWHAQDVRRLAATVELSERTVYRWFEAPARTHRGNARRLSAAALKLGIPLPEALRSGAAA